MCSNFKLPDLDRNVKWLLIGVVLLAFLLRIWGIDFGLPYLYHPDEPRYVIIAQNIFKTGDLNPHWFNYPSLFYYLNALMYITYYPMGKLAGMFHSPLDIPAPITLTMGVGKTPMPSTFLLGRLLTANFGTASIILIFLAGRQLTNNTAVGLLAALMMAISPTNVKNSHLITPDTFLVFFILLSFWGCVKIFQQGGTWNYVFTGISVGLVASTKYNGAIIVFPMLIAHFLSHESKCSKNFRCFKEPKLHLALILSVIVFLITTPFAILDHQQFLNDLQFEIHHYSTGHSGMEGNALNWYLEYLWKVEGLVSLLAILEILRGFYARSKQTALCSAFPVIYFPFISSFVVRNARTLLPLTPFLFLLASSFLVNLFKKKNTWQSNKLKLVALCAVVVLIILSLIFPFMQTVKDDIQLITVDSRETARIWIANNLPPGAKIVIESYAPYVDPKSFYVHGVYRMIDHKPDWYIDNGFDYLIFGEGMFGRFYREPDKYPKEVSQYEYLFHTFDLVKQFTDGGYEVRIYRVMNKE